MSYPISINDLAERIRKTAVEHGWEDTSRSFGDEIALWHSECSEAFEEYRNGKNEDETYWRDPEGKTWNVNATHDLKPEGCPTEAADVIIRILHWMEKRGINAEQVILNKMAYNETRPYRHGGKVL